MPLKCNKVTVLLDEEEFERFRCYCDGRGFKKSTLIARLIREHLDSERFAIQAELPLRAAGIVAPRGKELVDGE
jgi:hypothetical protein